MPPATAAPTAAPPLPNPVLKGETPITAPPTLKPRSPQKDLESFFGGKKPEPQKSPTPAPEPHKEAPKAAEDNPAPVAPEKPPVEPVAPQETPKAQDDIDALIEEATPKQKPKPTEEPQGGPAELRKELARIKAEHAKLQEEIKKQAEDRNGDDTKTLLEQLKKEREELAQKLEFHDFTQSPRYNEQYVKPVQDGIASAIELAKRLKHQTEERTGTDRDVYALYQLYASDISAATELADTMFGKAGDRILSKIESIYDAEKRRITAVEDWQKTAASRKAEEQAEAEKQFQGRISLYREQIDRERASRPDIYDFSGDPELASLHKKAETFVEPAFLPDPDRPIEETVRHQAKVRMLAAVAIPLLKRVSKAQAEIDSLRKALAEYDGSNPKVKPSGESHKGEIKHGLQAVEDYFKT